MTATPKPLWRGSNLFGFTFRIGPVEARTWHTNKGAGYRVVTEGTIVTYYASRYATNMGDAMRRAETWARRMATASPSSAEGAG